MAIQDNHIQTEHCPGKRNVIADTISRQTTSTTDMEEKNITLNRLAKRVDKIGEAGFLQSYRRTKKRPKAQDHSREHRQSATLRTNRRLPI